MDASLNLVDPVALKLGVKTSDVQYRFLDDDGKPLLGASYILVKEDGGTEDGKTDGNGQTKKYTSSSPEKCVAYLLSAEA